MRPENCDAHIKVDGPVEAGGTGVAQARFVLMPRALVGWRLVSASEPKELGRALVPGADHGECRRLVEELLHALPSLRSRVRRRRGEAAFTWVLESRGAELAASPGDYPSSALAHRGASAFLMHAAFASVPEDRSEDCA